MPSILQDILRQKLLEIQSQLPAYVKLIKDTGPSFENILQDELSGTAMGSIIPSRTSFVYNGEFNQIIEDIAKKYNISSSIIKAVIKAESDFDPNAVSKTGAMGLMQLMPDTAKALGVTNAFDPIQNINGGVKYLKEMLAEFGGNLEYALAAYNAGPNSVKKYGGIPPFTETQNYVRSIMSTLRNKL
ncbi:MAG: lytic transglycosylase domain-containing protein [Caulobacteraceae bacterium]